MYIWQDPHWPTFVYQLPHLAPGLDQVLALQQQLIGAAKSLPAGLDQQAEMDALIQEALQTSEIEGETLDADSVRSSVARHLGLEQAGLPSGTRQTESLIAMLCDATRGLDKPVTQRRLCEWQAALFSEPSVLRNIAIGRLRGDAPMRVVSHRAGREIVHFEAPPLKLLKNDLKKFIEWFNAVDQNLPGIVRVALAHLWFITLHPFEDGNGRVARALTDRALAQVEQTSIRFYSLSATLEANRKNYYQMLENTQNCNTATQVRTENAMDVTEWINWFLSVLAEAMQQGIQRIERVVAKPRFWKIHSQTVLSARQIKVLNRLLDSAGEEFVQGINAGKYQSLANVSKATATRDLIELVNKGCLRQMPGGGRSTRYQVV